MKRIIFVLLVMSLMILCANAAEAPRQGDISPLSRTIFTAPYSQSFDGIPQGQLPEGWQTNDAGHASPLPWAVNHNQACCFFSQVYIGESRQMWSPWIAIPGPQYRLFFKWSHGQRPDYNMDVGRVFVYDINNNSTKVWERSGTAFNSNDGYTLPANSIGVPGTGVLESIDLGRWAGQSIFVLFAGASSWGPAWYVDDFSVQYQDTAISTFPSTQSFASASFPPQYWTVPNSWEAPELNAWWQSSSNAYGASGSGSALCSFQNFQAGSQISLCTQNLNLGAYGGKLSYDYAYSPYLAANASERLDIQYSLNYGISFSTFASFNAGDSGGLATAAPHSASWVPSATDWATRSLNIPPGTTQIRFLGTSAYNGKLFIDNIRFEKNYFPSGNGTQADPFTVSNATELNLIRNYLGSSSSRSYFKLCADIDLLSYLSAGGEGFAAWGTNGWLPIGNSSTMFYGSLDGNGHSISNLRTAYYGNYHGLFGVIAAGSEIKNLTLANNCFILGDSETGAVVGRNNGTLQNCSSAATVNLGNAESGGGMAGFNNGTISNCSFSGSLARAASNINSNKLGGIAGTNAAAANISNSQSSGSISGSLWNGGLVGWNNGTINNSFSTGSVNSNNNTNGGLVGQNQGAIHNSYSHVNVVGAHYLGGLVGYHGSGSISNCYSTGTVSGGQKGGLIGASGGSISNSYWDTQSSGQSTSYGGTGKNTAQMKTQSTYTGWDFTLETANGTNDYWNINPVDNSGYPDLVWRYANEIKSPVLQSPANNAYGVPLYTATVAWTPNPLGQSPHHYSIYLVKDNPAQLFNAGYASQHTISNITGTSCNLVANAGLCFDFGETWYWSVVAYSASGNASLPAATQSFHIQKDQFITESFETDCINGSTFIPEWTQVLEAESSNWIVNSSYTSDVLAPRTGAFNLYMYHSGGAPDVTWLFHPITLAASYIYDIELYARQQSLNPNYGSIGIYYGTAATISAMTNAISGDTYLDTSEYKRIAGSFTVSGPGTYYLGIRSYLAGSTNYLALDDISLSIAIPNPPTLISPTNQSTFVNTKPTFSWLAPVAGIAPSSYKLCISTEYPPTIANLNATINAPLTTYTLPEPLALQPATTYYWSVFAEAQGKLSENSSVYSFTTMPVSAFTEGFEAGSLPGGWTVYNLDGGTKSWEVNDYNPITGAYSACIFAELSRQNDDWLISPRLGGSELVADNFRFSLRKIYSNYPEEYEVLVSTTDTQPASFTAIASGSIPNIQVFTQNYNLDAFGGAYFYIAIRYLGNHENGIILDDVFGPPLYTAIPLDIAAISLCGPSTLATGKSYSYTVNIRNNGFALQTGYNVYLKCLSPQATIASFAMPALGGYASANHIFHWIPDASYLGNTTLFAEVALAGDTVAANNLSPGLAVNILPWELLNEGFESGSIPANWTVLNADGGTSIWSTSSGNSAHSGGYGAQVYYENSTENDDWLITPPLMLSTARADSISFWMKGDSGDPWQVLISITDTNPASFSIMDSGVAYSSWIQKTYSLDAYGNAVVYVAIRAFGSALFLLSVDDFTGPPLYSPGSTLDAPQVNISLVGGNILLNWAAVPGATSYQVYSSADMVHWETTYTTVAAPSHSLSIALGANSRRFFKVKAMRFVNE